MVTLGGSGLSNVMQTVTVGTFEPSVDQWKRSTFVAPWRRRESRRSSSDSERGTLWMMPFFPMDDFGRLALRDLLAALVNWRTACCWVRSDGKMNRSPPRGVSGCFGAPAWFVMSWTMAFSSTISISLKLALPSVTLRMTGARLTGWRCWRLLDSGGHSSDVLFARDLVNRLGSWVWRWGIFGRAMYDIARGGWLPNPLVPAVTGEGFCNTDTVGGSGSREGVGGVFFVVW